MNLPILPLIQPASLLSELFNNHELLIAPQDVYCCFHIPAVTEEHRYYTARSSRLGHLDLYMCFLSQIGNVVEPKLILRGEVLLRKAINSTRGASN
jgi:hypothetical protein